VPPDPTPESARVVETPEHRTRDWVVPAAAARCDDAANAPCPALARPTRDPTPPMVDLAVPEMRNPMTPVVLAEAITLPGTFGGET